MKIRQFLTLSMLLLSIFSGATNPTIVSKPTGFYTVDRPPCDLPAPSNFHIKGLGPDWVTFEWDAPVSPNVQHRIRLYRTSDNVLLSTTIVPAGITESTISIPVETEVYAVINAICENNEHSPNNATSSSFTGVILDLIVSGFQGSSNEVTCSFMGIGDCDFNHTGYSTFRVAIGDRYSRKFDIERDIDTENLRFFVRPENGNNSAQHGSFNFYCPPNGSPDCSAPLLTIKFVSNGIEYPAASFNVSQNTQTVYELRGTAFTFGQDPFRIERLTPYSNQGKQAPSSSHIRIRERANENIIVGAISPNPFSNELTISFEQKPETPQTIQLFSAEGRLALQETIPANQSSHTLATAHLAPGFYFLRIEADGEVQTYKLIKSAQ